MQGKENRADVCCALFPSRTELSCGFCFPRNALEVSEVSERKREKRVLAENGAELWALFWILFLICRSSMLGLCQIRLSQQCVPYIYSVSKGPALKGPTTNSLARKNRQNRTRVNKPSQPALDISRSFFLSYRPQPPILHQRCTYLPWLGLMLGQILSVWRLTLRRPPPLHSTSLPGDKRKRKYVLL